MLFCFFALGLHSPKAVFFPFWAFASQGSHSSEQDRAGCRRDGVSAAEGDTRSRPALQECEVSAGYFESKGARSSLGPKKFWEC